jgi:hypothetical protein
MRLALLLSTLPLRAEAGANPEAVYQNLITGIWAETSALCAADATWAFAKAGLTIRSDGQETCAFDRPGADGGFDVVLDVHCPVSDATLQISARRIGLDLASVSPGLRDPGDQLTVSDKEQTLTLQRCQERE